MSPRHFAPLVAIAFALAACASAPGPTTGTEPAPTTTVSLPDDTTSTTLLPGTEDLPESVRVELAGLIALTEEIRRLEFLHTPDIVVVTSDELAERVRERLEEQLEDIPVDEALYRLLGLIDSETDLATLYTELYSEQVAGYYDGEVGELVVPRSGEGFTVVQRATLVHELTHALTDQHYEFHPRYSGLIDEDRYDQASAFQALIEGDAVLTELLYLQGLSTEEQAEFFRESFAADSDILDSVPRFIREALIFPYDRGFRFVERLFRNGGFDAIARAYREPPISTEQVIHPEKYPQEVPLAVDLPAVTVEGFELEYASTWGELGFQLLLGEYLDEDSAAAAARGWGGDAYAVYFDGADVLLVLRYRGDTVSDAETLASALDQYVTAAMDISGSSDRLGGTAHTGDANAWIRIEGDEVLFVASSSPVAFDTAVSALAQSADEAA